MNLEEKLIDRKNEIYEEMFKNRYFKLKITSNVVAYCKTFVVIPSTKFENDEIDILEVCETRLNLDRIPINIFMRRYKFAEEISKKEFIEITKKYFDFMIVNL